MKKNKIFALGCFIISFFIPFLNYEKEVYVSKVMAKEVNNFFSDEINNADNNNPLYDYVAVLEIPSIKLLNGLVSVDNSYNNVEYNIEIIDGGDMPDIKYGNFILAAHNGSSAVSFFKNLEKLLTNDIVYVYYKHKKYSYKIASSYIVDKIGSIDLYRDITRNTITLITCKNGSIDKQIVYVGYLHKIESY